MNKLFGERLQFERKKQGMTVEIIAKACEISGNDITLIEDGRSQPEIKFFKKIALALHLKTQVVLNWYLEGIG